MSVYKLQTQTVVSHNVLQPITTSNKISCLSNLSLVLSVCAPIEIWESESRIGLDKTGNCSVEVLLEKEMLAKVKLHRGL